ncbi:helix-turn-helix domain-containing protein [Paenibacillus tuaregi]|uniref:helix-turn-helix domain-containing protein n=1 Tax=Paenibacillus tuaregi TaxID=1816681 RepID=UPI000AC83A02|nr:helix-turn-helix domain-containing protein [Paenibacillus tuaregi]
MGNSKMDLIMHPIRMRIIQTLITGKQMTTQQLTEMLSDVPQATMYRHLNKLREAKLIEVVEQNQIRGTVEKVYSLAKGGADSTPEDVTQAASEEHMQMFMKFTASLIADFGDYLQQPEYNLIQDGVSFRQTQFYLTDEEYVQMLQDIRAQMARYSGRVPGRGRRRRMMSTIIIPGRAENQQQKTGEDTNDDNQP